MEDLERDLRFLRKIWAQIETRAKTAKGPSLVFREADLSLRVIRDVLSRNVEEVLVDSERQYRRILGFVRTTQPELAERIKLYSGAKPMFERYGVEAAIRSTLNRRVDLPSGGYLIFDYAEAFTVIDVNTGRFVGKTGRLEDTITKNNIEAAREVMRQLRLRDIGGIIVIDFIDMEKAKNRAEVLSVLQAELGKDRTKTYLVEISPLGLVEMTRQNVTEGVRELLTSTCPTCGGEGRVLSVDTMGVEAERKLRKLARSVASEAMLIKMNAKVASRLVGPGGERLIELERETGKWFTHRGRRPHPAGGAGRAQGGHPRRDRRHAAGQGRRGGQAEDRRAAPVQPVGRRCPRGRLSGGRGRGRSRTSARSTRCASSAPGATTAYATLLDAKPKALEIPQDPAEFEIPEFDREIGERLELEDRSRNRRRPHRQDAQEGRGGEAGGVPIEHEGGRCRGRGGARGRGCRRRGAGRGRRGRCGQAQAPARHARRPGTHQEAGDRGHRRPTATSPRRWPSPRRPRRSLRPSRAGAVHRRSPRPDAETPQSVPASANGDEPAAKPAPRRRTRTTKPKDEPAAAVEAPARACGGAEARGRAVQPAAG